MSIVNNRTCAVVVTYNPTVKKLNTMRENFKNLQDFLVYDNGSADRVKTKIKGLVAEFKNRLNEDNRGIYFINGKENLGLAKAYNISIKFLKEKNYEFVLILDQDSKLSIGTTEKLLAQYERLSENYRIGAISPTVIQEGQGPLNAFFDGRFRWKGLSYEDRFVLESPFLINSGTFMQIKILDEIGHYDETLFLDSVDHEMSFRMRYYGYHLFIVKEVLLRQNVDNKIDFKLFWIKLDREGHSPTSDYYLVRDSMRVAKRYLKYYWPQSLLLFCNVIIKFVATLFIYRHKNERFAMIIKGLKDFILSL